MLGPGVSGAPPKPGARPRPSPSPTGTAVSAPAGPLTFAEVDRLVAEQKYEAAAAVVARIRERAQAAKDEPAWTRALVREVQLRTALHGYETSVRFLREQPWPPGPLAQATLDLFYGQSLVNYLSAYSWEIRQREKVESKDAVDLKEVDRRGDPRRGRQGLRPRVRPSSRAGQRARQPARRLRAEGQLPRARARNPARHRHLPLRGPARRHVPLEPRGERALPPRPRASPGAAGRRAGRCPRPIPWCGSPRSSTTSRSGTRRGAPGSRARGAPRPPPPTPCVLQRSRRPQGHPGGPGTAPRRGPRPRVVGGGTGAARAVREGRGRARCPRARA